MHLSLNWLKFIGSLSFISLIGSSVQAQSTSFTYNKRGDLLTQTSQSRKVTSYNWDTLGRVTGVNKNGASSVFGYNGQNNLVSVQDPKGLTTQYTLNGFGQITAKSSPDTGSTSYTVTLTDKISQNSTSGVVTGWSYDNEDRINSKTVTHPTAGSVTYNYRYGTSGVEAGLYTGHSSSNGSFNIAYAHNQLGQVLTKTQASLVYGFMFNTSYTYSAGGVNNGLTNVSGRVVTYSLDAIGRISAIQVEGVTVVSNVTYSPVGVTGWTYGNGSVVTRTYDTSGRTTGVTLGTGQRTYAYDTDNNIININDAVLGSATYGYDGQNRLASANTSIGNWTYTYDANGSRTSTDINGGTYAVSVDTASNKTLAYSANVVRQVSYNSQGNTSSLNGGAPVPACGGSVDPNYTSDGLMVSSNTVTNIFDESGLRLYKQAAACAGGASIAYNYDLQGHLIGEYAQFNAPLREIIWLGDIPVAVFTGAKGSSPAFYIYTDNLNTPRQIMSTSNQLVWS